MSRTRVKGQTIIDDVSLNGVESIKIPSGTTAERPSTALAGQIRFNTTEGSFEGYDGSTWGGLGNGGGGGGGSVLGDITVEKHAGDNITTNFTLGQAPIVSANSVQIDINGITQEPDVAYTVDLVSNYVTFTDPPAQGDRITIKYLRELENSITIANALSPSAFAGNITQTDDNDKVLIFDASSNSVQAVFLEDLGVGGEGKWTIVASAYTAKKGERIGINSTNGSFTITLPLGSTVPLGTAIAFADAGGDLTANNVTIDATTDTVTNLFNISANTFILDVDGASVGLFWTGTTWRTY